MSKIDWRALRTDVHIPLGSGDGEYRIVEHGSGRVLAIIDPMMEIDDPETIAEHIVSTLQKPKPHTPQWEPIDTAPLELQVAALLMGPKVVRPRATIAGCIGKDGKFRQYVVLFGPSSTSKIQSYISEPLPDIP